jgi:hypothetical protein
LQWSWRHWRSIPSLLLRWAENQSARCDILLLCSELRVRNNSIPWWLNTRGSSRSLPFLLGTMCHDTVFLGQSHTVLALTRFRRSLSFVLRPRRIRSYSLASLSA